MNKYKKHTKLERAGESVLAWIRDFIIIALTCAIVVGGYLLLSSEKVSAASLKTTLTGLHNIEEIIQKNKGYDIRSISEYIAKYEDFSSTPFPDPSGIGTVIGYGFQPRGREHMTREQGNAILDAEVKRLIPQIIERYGYVSQNKMTALVSILYNTPTYRKVITNNEIVEDFKQGNREKLEKHFHHSLRGIRIRRSDDLALYFNQQVL